MLSSARAKRRVAERRFDLIFQALSDGTRRRLIDRLSLGPAMVTELAEPFTISLPAVSRHLKVLEHAGLVKRSVDGRIHHCSLAVRPFRDLQKWLDAYRPFWEEKLDALSRYVEGDKGKR
jgi:DNA-binding transcriptional ArsR family regulator